ncbi:MAG: HEPN domain-containing protein [Alphaproteobacteria bacterium]|nr:HEPN domain-containing protein [Alphaproteobacteria bacterium]
MSDTKCARLLVEAAEKLFKAWLALLGEIYPLVHDLRRLLEMVTAHEPEARRFRALVEYTPYAMQFRYTGQDMLAGSLDRGKIVEEVSALLEEVRRRLTSMKG